MVKKNNAKLKKKHLSTSKQTLLPAPFHIVTHAVYYVRIRFHIFMFMADEITT